MLTFWLSPHVVLRHRPAPLFSILPAVPSASITVHGMVINVVCYLARLCPWVLPSLRLRVPRCRHISPHRLGPPGAHGGHTSASSAHSGYHMFCQPRVVKLASPLLGRYSLSSTSLCLRLHSTISCSGRCVAWPSSDSSEFTCPSAFDSTIHLTATDVSIDPTSTIHLWLKSSKTDPFRQCFMIHIGSSGKPICPVAALRAYLDLRGHALGPLFVTSTLPATPVIVNHWSVPSSRPPAMVHPSAAIASGLGPPPQLRRLVSRTTSSTRLGAGPATRTNATFVRLQTYGTCVMLIGWAAPFWRRVRAARIPRSSKLEGSHGRGASRPRRNTTKFGP